MAEALILVTTDPGVMVEVCEEIGNMEHIKKAAIITGPHDIMAMAEGEDLKRILGVLMNKIRNIEGVRETVTNVIIGP